MSGEVKEVKEAVGGAGLSAGDLLLSAAKKGNLKYTEPQWVSFIDVLDRHWIDSANDLALVFHSGLAHILRLPSDLQATLAKMLDAEDAAVVINLPPSPISIPSPSEGESAIEELPADVLPPAPAAVEYKEFVYTSDFDGKGILYFLGTNLGVSAWENPMGRGLVRVRASSLEKDSVPETAVVGLYPLRCVTKNENLSWFEIDFLTRSIAPSAYTLRHYSSWDTEALRNWRLEGSNDGLSWVTIREHLNDASLAKSGQSFTWSLSQPRESFYSRFRIIQTDKNSNNHYYLALSGFEIYGKLKDTVLLPSYLAASVPEMRNIKTFRHSSDFDTNGLFYYLGSSGLSAPWVNPVDLGEVIVTASDLSNDSVKEKYFVGRETVRLVTKNRDKSWFAVQLKNSRIQPSAYTLRHYSSWDTEVVRSWRFEGSNDGHNWELIRAHDNDTSIPSQKGATRTWTVHCASSYSYFRIFQTGKNSNNHFYLAVSGFEVYGDVEFLNDRKDDLSFEGDFKSMVENAKLLSYVHDLDTNGLFYHIGTQGGASAAYNNPAASGVIKISSTNLELLSDPVSALLGRAHASVQTAPTINAYIEFDLQDYQVCPNQYYLRHHFLSDTDALRSWRLEGFEEESKSWVILSEHVDDSHLNAAGSSHVWVCSRPPVAFFSRLRIIQTGPNSSKFMRIALSNFEIYGYVNKRSIKAPSLDVAWDRNCCSSNLEISDTLLVNPGSNNSWQTCRLDKLFSGGVCEVSFRFEKSPSTTNSWKASVGLAPVDFFPKGKMQWLGSQNSWAYIAGSGCKCFGSSVANAYGEKFDEGDVITIIADFTSGKISFNKNGGSQGVAFTNLKDPVYPAVSLTGTGSSFRLISFKNQDGVFDSRGPAVAPAAASAFVPAPWDDVVKTQDLFVNPEDYSMVTNLFDQNKWEMARSQVSWDLKKEKVVEFQIKIVEDPPTKNKWKFMIGVCPSSFKINSKPPVWLDKGCWAYVAGNGSVFYDDVKNPEPYGSILNKNDVLTVRLDCASRKISFAINGQFGSELPWKTLDSTVHAAVCMTAQNASVQLSVKI
jgi:hypothetical protein